MPIQTPPPPVVQPNPTPQRPTAQPVTVNNDVNTPSNSNSVSEAENTSVNSAALNAYQVNSNHETNYFKYANGVTVPGTSVYGNLSAINDNWDWGRTNVVATVGIRHTFGGSAKNLALTSVRRDNLARTLSMCNSLGVFEGKVEINYEMSPELSDCQYITQKVAVPAAPEVKILKQEMKQYKRLIEEQQKTIKAFELRLIQMRVENNTPISVGG